jgi:hypothetical protein
MTTIPLLIACVSNFICVFRLFLAVIGLFIDQPQSLRLRQPLGKQTLLAHTISFVLHHHLIAQFHAFRCSSHPFFFFFCNPPDNGFRTPSLIPFTSKTTAAPVALPLLLHICCCASFARLFPIRMLAEYHMPSLFGCSCFRGISHALPSRMLMFPFLSVLLILSPFPFSLLRASSSTRHSIGARCPRACSLFGKRLLPARY